MEFHFIGFCDGKTKLLNKIIIIILATTENDLLVDLNSR